MKKWYHIRKLSSFIESHGGLIFRLYDSDHKNLICAQRGWYVDPWYYAYGKRFYYNREGNTIKVFIKWGGR